MWLSDILGRVFTILLCAWLMFLFPLMDTDGKDVFISGNGIFC